MRALDPQVSRRVFASLEQLTLLLDEQGWPLAQGYVEEMQGRPGVFKRRLGSHRVLFLTRLSEHQVQVVAVAHRREAYRD